MERSIKLKSRQFARVGKSRPKHLSVSKTKNFIKNLFSAILFKKDKIFNETQEG